MADVKTENEIKPSIVEIATIDKDITRGYVAGLLQWQDDILNLKGGGDLKIAQDVKYDDQVFPCLQQRFSAVKSCEWEVLPGGDGAEDKKAADWLRELLEALDWDCITEEMLWAVFYGFSIAELMLISDGKYWTLDKTKGGIRIRNRRRFRFDKDFNPRLITFDNSFMGEEIHPSRLWYFRSGGDNSDVPEGEGLWRWLYFLTLFKRGDMKHWLNYLERFAQPTPGVELPFGAGEDEKAKGIKLAQSIKAGAAFVKTQGYLIELVEASRSGTADYSALWDKCNAAISKIILSETMTTDSGSSRSQAEVHQGVADAIVKGDADLVCQSFNRQVVTMLCAWNFPNALPPKVWRQVQEDEDINNRADRDAKLFDMGIRLLPESVPEIYGDEYQIQDGKETVLLNGAQVTGLNQLIKDAAAGALPVESAKQLMIAALGIPEAIADKIIKPIEKQQKEAKAAEEAQQQADANLFPDTGQAASASNEFSEFYALDDVIEFAAAIKPGVLTKKNCTKGVYCIGETGKGSCVKAGSKCKSKAGSGSVDYTAAIGPEPKAGAKAGKTAKTESGPTKTAAMKKEAEDKKLQEILDAVIANYRAGEIAYWEERTKKAKDSGPYSSRVADYNKAQIKYAEEREYKKLEDLTDEEKTALKKITLTSTRVKKEKDLAEREAAVIARAGIAEKRLEEEFTRHERDVLSIGSPELRTAKSRVADVDAELIFAFPEEVAAKKAELKSAKAELRALTRKEDAEYRKIGKIKGSLYSELLSEKADITAEFSKIIKEKEKSKNANSNEQTKLVKLVAKSIDPSAADMPDLGGKKRDAELRKEAVRIYGEETIKKAEQNLKKITETSDLMVRLNESSLGLVIDGTRFKTSTELGNKGVGYDRKRLEVEDRAFTGGKGYIPDATKTAVYGYLGNKNNPYGPTHDSPGAYGDMAVVLRKEAVRDRTSFSSEDSFRGLGVSRLDDPKIASLMPLVEKGRKTGALGGTDPYIESASLVKGLAKSNGTIDDVIDKTRSPYFEYQVHGGVKSSEIGEIHYYNDAKPAKNIEDWAKNNGVAIVRHPAPAGTIKKKGLFDDIPDDWFDDPLD